MDERIALMGSTGIDPLEGTETRVHDEAVKAASFDAIMAVPLASTR